MSSKKELVEKARKLGYEYLHKYTYCAPTTLLAVADTLGIKVSDETFKASIGLSGPSGGCGGICGGIAAFGLCFGVGREEFAASPSSPEIREASEYLQARFVETYGSYLCDDIRLKLFGRLEDVPKSEYEHECPLVCENAAGWVVEAILATKQHT